MFNIGVVGDVFLSILTVVPTTLGVALAILVMSFMLGAVLAVLQTNANSFVYRLIRVYISFMRGTPLLVQLYIAYYSLPEVIVYVAAIFGISIDVHAIPPLVAILFSYTLDRAATQAENIRGALGAVEVGQMEAAYSIGLNKFQAYTRIIFPQALVVAIPNICNMYIGTIKGLSLAFLVTFVDILAKAKLESAINFRYVESYIAAMLVYWILCSLLSVVFSKLELSLGKGRNLVH